MLTGPRTSSRHIGRAASSLRQTDIHHAEQVDWHGGFIVTLPTNFASSARLGASPYHIGRAVSLLQSAELLARTPRAWGLGPRPCRGLRTLSDLSQINGCLCPATNPNSVINTEHINQLSRFHAKKLSVLNFVRFDQALYFFGKKLFKRKSLS